MSIAWLAMGAFETQADFCPRRIQSSPSRRALSWPEAGTRISGRTTPSMSEPWSGSVTAQQPRIEPSSHEK